MSIKKKWRRLFGGCPYCGEKLKEGFGGSTSISLSRVKVCPNRHYAEEMQINGVTLIFDQGGRPIDIHGDIVDPVAVHTEREHRAIIKQLKGKQIQQTSISNNSVVIKFSDDTFLDIKLDKDACEIITTLDD